MLDLHRAETLQPAADIHGTFVTKVVLTEIQLLDHVVFVLDCFEDEPYTKVGDLILAEIDMSELRLSIVTDQVADILNAFVKDVIV